MSLEILDPTHEADTGSFTMPARLTTLAGKSITVISNGKQGTGRFFNALESELSGLGVDRVVRLTKSNFSAPAEASVMQKALQSDAIVAGIGD